MKPRIALVSFLFVLVTAGCELVATDVDRIVGGVNLTEMFAPATSAEIAAVKADWASRSIEARDIRVVRETPVQIAESNATLRIVSHTVGDVLHYGAIIVPAGATDASLPVMLYLHGGDSGVAVDSEVLFILQFFADLADGFVVVIPSYRDETVRFGAEKWTSAGPASPWDYDVDDALSLLNVALAITPQANPDRIAAFGLSRGAGVALLAAARDPRIDRVVEFMGPTDFFGPFVQDVTEEALSGMSRNLPGLDVLNARFLEPLATGATTVAEVRLELARRSAVLFASDLPFVQLHHGKADSVVPVSQAESLIRTMEGLNRSAPDFQAFLYDGVEHNPLAMFGAFDEAASFLRRLTVTQ